MVSDQLCEYYGLITHLDEQIGRILDALRASPHGRNTIVVYTADHGLAMGSHGLLGKQNLYEQSMKCPLIIAGPGIPANKRTKAFTYVHDLTATIYGVTTVTGPQNADSADLAPLWTGEKEQVRDAVFLAFQDNMRSVRDDRWKLHLYPGVDHALLFDLKNDPDETRNLAYDPEYASQVKRLHGVMRDWQLQVGDTLAIPVGQTANPPAVVYDNSKRVLDGWQPKWIRDKYFGGRDNTNHGPKKK